MKILPILLLAALFLGSGCSKPPVPYERSPWPGVYPSEQEKIDLNVSGWKFFWATEANSGDPVSAFYRLYATKSNSLVKLESPSDIAKLTGISIQSPQEAIKLLRVFTDERAYFRFSSFYAIESPKSAMKLKDANGQFVMTRQILYAADNGTRKFPSYEIEERLSRDGTYVYATNRFIGFYDWPASVQRDLR